jgi:O-antigen/teichoic acid export membrane protein
MYLRIKKIINSDREIISKLIKTFLTRGLSAIGTLVFHVVLARLMGVDEYGIFVIAYSLIIGASLFAKFGMTSAILRFSSIMFKNREFGKILKLKRDVTYLTFFVSIIFSILISSNTESISVLFFDGIDVKYLLFVFSISLPFYSFLTIQSSFLKSFSRPEIAPLFEIGLMVLFTAFFTFIYSLFFDIVTSFNSSIFFLISCFFIFLSGNYTIKKVLINQIGYKKNNYEKYQGFYSTLFSFGLSNLSSYFLKFSPILLLGYYFTSTEVSYYSIANNSAFLINFVLWIVSSVYAPYFANLFKENKIAELNKLLIRATIYMLIIAVPVFLIIVIFPNFILSIFDPNFSGSTSPLLILAFAQLVNVATGPVLFLMNMIGREKELMIIIMITSILTIVLGLILVPKYSYHGAAISTAIGLITQNIIAVYKSKKYIKIMKN